MKTASWCGGDARRFSGIYRREHHLQRAHHSRYPASLTGDNIPRRLEVRGEVSMPQAGFETDERRGAAQRRVRSPIRATPPPVRCASSIRAITAKRPLIFFAMASGWLEGGELPRSHFERLMQPGAAWGLPVSDRAQRRTGSEEVLLPHRQVE